MCIFEHGVYLMGYGDNFRRLREDLLKLKQGPLSEIMGCSRYHVGRVESNKAEYTYSQIRALEEVTGFAIADLIELAATPPPWMAEYLDLKPASRRKVDAIINAAVKVIE
ncbi:MAG: helix-turn-helix transcriptional regulator [Oleispira sp.]|nr:helix-turn-helix transcriptional regulator [Oleispira sp.]